MRPNWDLFFLIIAEAVALRGDCSRRQVGALIVDEENRIVSAGYNGTVPGRLGCLEGACPRAKSNVAPGSSYDTGAGTCIAIHAEANAVIYSGRSKASGGTIYVSDTPCDGCRRLIQSAGISRVLTPKDLDADSAHLLVSIRSSLRHLFQDQGEDL